MQPGWQSEGGGEDGLGGGSEAGEVQQCEGLVELRELEGGEGEQWALGVSQEGRSQEKMESDQSNSLFQPTSSNHFQPSQYSRVERCDEWTPIRRR